MTPKQPPQPVATPRTALFELVKTKLGSDPIELIRERRSQTPPESYPAIAREIQAKTGVIITHETPRRWYQLSIGDPVRRGAKAA